jgi:hypothetical protein
MAARTGMTPEEFYRQHGFTVGDGAARTASQAKPTRSIFDKADGPSDFDALKKLRAEAYEASDGPAGAEAFRAQSDALQHGDTVHFLDASGDMISVMKSGKDSYTITASGGESYGFTAKAVERILEKEQRKLAEEPKPSDAGTLHQSDAQPVADLRGDEIAPAGTDSKGLRSAARDWFKENLTGKSVHSDALDADVTFSNSRKAIANSADPRKLKLFAAIPDIVAHGEKVDERPHTKAGDNIKAWHYLRATVTLDGEQIPVTLSVREDNNGHFYYNHVLEDRTLRTHRSHSRSGWWNGGAASNIGQRGDSGKTDDTYEQSPADDGVNMVLGQGDAPEGWGFADTPSAEEVADMMKPNANSHGRYNPATSTISLMKTANLSTFIHELGHHHLETLINLADAHEGIGKDADAILHWFSPA